VSDNGRRISIIKTVKSLIAGIKEFFKSYYPFP